MRLSRFRPLALMLLLLAAPTVVRADDPPDAEVGIGYSYMNVDVLLGDVDTHGWFASLQDNLTPWFGLAAEASGHYADGGNLHTIMGGPRFTYRGDHRVEPYGHVLAGVAFYDSFEETKFAMEAGGGVDVRVTESFAIRAVQVDYVPVFFDDTRHNFKVSSGVVFRFDF